MDLWGELRAKGDVIRAHWWTITLALASGIAGGFAMAGTLYSERLETVVASNELLRDQIEAGQVANAEALSPAISWGKAGWSALAAIALTALVSFLWASIRHAWQRRKTAKAPIPAEGPHGPAAQIPQLQDASQIKSATGSRRTDFGADDAISFIKAETGSVPARPHLQVTSATVDLTHLPSRGSQVRAMISLTNCTASDLTECSVQVHSIQMGSQLLPLGASIQRGKDRRIKFQIGAKATANTVIAYRNYDVAPDEPFIINAHQYLNALSENGPITLVDNATHYLNLVANSGAGVVTRAVLELKVGEYEELEVKLLGQSAFRRPKPKATS